MGERFQGQAARRPRAHRSARDAGERYNPRAAVDDGCIRDRFLAPARPATGP
jgi:hypothetical protein